MRRKIMITVLLALLSLGPLGAQGAGQIDGRVVEEDGDGVGGVTVVVSELGLVEITGRDGSFAFDAVPDGSYTVQFSLGDNASSQAVEVAGGTTEVEETVDWDFSFVETITVYSASRRRERIVDAPAAVTLVTEETLDREAATGQLTKVLEFTPGVETTQSGIFDIQINTRGFNSSLNRRVQPLIDGRDPSVPFLGSSEFSVLGNMQDMASVELVRGPSSALYGANAFNGVLNMVTKTPSSSLGGQFRLAAGELSSLKADLRWAAALSDNWFFKLNVGYSEGDDFTKDRRLTTEYAGLPREAVKPGDTYDTSNLSLRLDRDSDSHLLTFEAGINDNTGGTVVTGIGRVNLGDLERTFARVNFSTDHFNVSAYNNTRETPDQLATASGGRIFLDTENRKAEVQTNWDFNDGKARLVAGASYEEEEIDTANNQGFQTLVFAPVEHDFTGVYAQLDFDLSDNLKLVLAGRWDDSSLHDSQFSPKAALVWSVNNANTLRFSYNEAFQVGNYSEFFLDAPTAIPTAGGPISSVNLAGIEAALCTPFGISCGFANPVRVRALGNTDLEVEEIQGFEIGYSGIFGSKAFLTIDYYNNELSNFITDLLANPFGTVNPHFGGYTPPANHPLPALLLGTLQASLPPSLFAFLTNNVDGTPIFALASYTQAGQVDTQGIDLGLNAYLSDHWVFDFSYSWFDFSIKEQSVEDIFPNAPEHKATIGLTYNADKWGGSLKIRWVDDFFWAAGAFIGPVPSYETADISGHYTINDRIELGLNISNAFDDNHYQSFGGDILARRALASIAFRW